MGDGKSGSRRRAVGIRERVMARLTTAGEIKDPSGMASNVLAEAVGYPGSSVAFAQLLSGMERAGLIEREVRGKRTYRIDAAPAAAVRFAAGSGAAMAGAAGSPIAGSGPARPARGGAPAGGPAAGGPAAAETRRHQRDHAGGGLATAGQGELDYDELARRLLVQVVHRLAASPAGDAGPGHGGRDATLEQTVASLEQKLASVQSRQRRLTAENARLREQLQEAQQSLAQARERAAASPLGTDEVMLLERLLSPPREQPGHRGVAGAS